MKNKPGGLHLSPKNSFLRVFKNSSVPLLFVFDFSNTDPSLFVPSVLRLCSPVFVMLFFFRMKTQLEFFFMLVCL